MVNEDTPTRTALFSPSEATQSMEESLLKVSQLHRIAQATPEIFRGDDKDRTRYFL